MKAFLLLITLSQLVFSPILAQDTMGHLLTLRQAVEMATANNFEVKQSAFRLQASSVNARQARSNLLPDLFASVNHGINQGRSIDPFTNSYINQQVAFGNYAMSSSVIVFNGLRLRNLVHQNTLDLEAGRMDLQQTKDNVMLNVILAYLQVLNNEDQLEQSRNQAAVTRRQLERLEVMNRDGAIAPALLYDLKGQLANDDLAMINSQNAVNTAKLSLSQLMNVPYDPYLQVEKIDADTIPPGYAGGDAQAIFETALLQRPLVKAADLRRQSAAKGLQVARSGFFPVIALSGNINTNYSNAARQDVLLNTVEKASGDYVNLNGSKLPVMTRQSNYDNQKIAYSDQFYNNYSTSLIMSIRVPILNGFSARNRVALARIAQENAAVSAQTIKTQLGQDIQQAYFSMTAAADRYRTLLRQVDDFSESFRTAEVRFNAGVLTQVDYLVAKNNVDRARINLISARYDYVFRARILDYYRGSLEISGQ